MNKHCLLLWTVLLGFRLGTAFGQAYVMMPNDQRVDVERIVSKPNGDIVAYVNGVPTELKRGAYVQAVGVKPPQLNQATALMNEGKTKEAEELLKGVIRDSQFQSWDMSASVVLADLQIRAGQADAALSTIRVVDSRYGATAREMFPDLEFTEWKVKVAKGQGDALLPELDRLIEGENRMKAARALMVRGDVKAKKNQLKAAQLDYLRTVHFYKNEDSIQAEALYKVAATFKALGDTAKSQVFSNELKASYPDSEYVALAQAL